MAPLGPTSIWAQALEVQRFRLQLPLIAAQSAIGWATPSWQFRSSVPWQMSPVPMQLCGTLASLVTCVAGLPPQPRTQNGSAHATVTANALTDGVYGERAGPATL